MSLTPPFLLILGAVILCSFGAGWVLARRRGGETPPTETRTLVTDEEMACPERQYLFMGKVAHALRNPLTGVLMSAELLQEEDDPSQVRMALERILEQGRQIREIIMRIQEATALEACQYRLDLEAVQLRDAVQETVDLYQSRARVKGQHLAVEPFSDDVRVVADRRFLSSILGELVTNALKYAPKGTTVLIGGGSSELGFRVWVQDEGPGISVEERPLLFQRFVKLSPVPTAGESHIGLGLWSARVMAETLGGELRFEPAEPKGGRFVLDLLQAYLPPSTSTIIA